MSRDTMFHSSQNVGNQIGNVRHVKVSRSKEPFPRLNFFHRWQHSSNRVVVQVHAPPGGASSFSLGWGNEPAPAQRSGVRRTVDPYAPNAQPTPAQSSYSAAPSYAAPAYEPAITTRSPAKENITYGVPAERKVAVSSVSTLGQCGNLNVVVLSRFPSCLRLQNAYANGANQNAGNFLTDRPTSKVLAPPGGRTSIMLG